MRDRDPRRIEFGDWQTPLALARQVVRTLHDAGLRPRSVIEPTCGTGTFLLAAREFWSGAVLVGLDVNGAYVETARSRLGDDVQLAVADFFAHPWEKDLSRLPVPLLVLGNPPWVTSAQLGTLGSANVPMKTNFKGLRGVDAITGKSNFDVSEWMLLRLLGAMDGRDAALAMFCKAAVARRVLEHVSSHGPGVAGELRRFDAMEHFGASIEAVLLTVRQSARVVEPDRLVWPVFDSLDAQRPSRRIGVFDGALCSDVDAFMRSRHLEGSAVPEWRSGLKHDCGRVMEFRVQHGQLVNGAGEHADIEEEYVYPLLKGSDIANGRLDAARAVLVTQRGLGDDTTRMGATAPRTWDYLDRHRPLLDARRSSIYEGQPPFAVFGVGDYTFASWKVAVSGLHKRLHFELVGPRNGRPVVLDDTCYFLPYRHEIEARRALDALRSASATEFLTSRIFWDAKRPINKAVLQALDMGKLEEALGMTPSPDRRSTGQRQQKLVFPS
ncbi:MAG: SAM-dependent DNA methyltransferase [Myxococcota bacterium]|nr:SAM-dependent DNA methyltransferase [Myxococcota bacterium]